MTVFADTTYTCEGVRCPGCGIAAGKVTAVVEDPDYEPFGERPPRDEVTFRFAPCGCRWTPGDRIRVNLHFGDAPDWLSPAERTAWNESGRALLIAIEPVVPEFSAEETASAYRLPALPQRTDGA